MASGDDRGCISRRTFLAGLLGGAVTAMTWGCVRGRPGLRTDAPPNIVLVLADDLGYGDLGCYGQSRFETPRADRMAAEGIRFTRFYSGAPVSAPARASLLTGRHTGHIPIRNNANPILGGETTTCADLLRERGYATGLFGKWGLGDAEGKGAPDLSGFDRFFGYMTHQDAHRQRPEQLWENRRPLPLPPGTFAHDRIVDRALAFVRENRDRPFFLFLSPTLPHPDLDAPEETLRLFRGRYPETPFEPAEGKEYGRRAEPRATYAAMVHTLDRDMGRLLDLIDSLGIGDRTLVLFTSDNGTGRAGGLDPDFFGSLSGLRGGKRTLYEGGIRIPMIARWRGVIPAGAVSDRIGALWEMPSTFAEVAGASAPSEMDGASLLPLLRGAERPDPEVLYWEIHRPALLQAARIGKWKGIRNRRTGVFELYDVENDPGETRDLSAERPGIRRRIEEAMRISRTPRQDAGR